MVDKLLVNAEALSNYSQVYSDANVEKEIAMNLLDHMLTLYLRVRSFSYAEDHIETHKIEKNKQRSRSLRTEIKKSSITCKADQ